MAEQGLVIKGKVEGSQNWIVCVKRRTIWGTLLQLYPRYARSFPESRALKFYADPASSPNSTSLVSFANLRNIEI